MLHVHTRARDFAGALEPEQVEGLKGVLERILGAPLQYPLEKREIVVINQRIHAETVRYNEGIVRAVRLDRRWFDTIHVQLYQPERQEIDIRLIYDED